MSTTETSNTSQRWFRSEVAAAFAFGAVLWGIFSYLSSPQIKQQQTNDDIKQSIALIQQDISNINKNHEVHIQDITQQLKTQNDQILQLNNQVVQIETENQIILKKLK